MKSFSVSREMFGLATDFADYLEIPLFEMSTMYIAEQADRLDGLTIATMDQLFLPQRRVFPAYQMSVPKKFNLFYDIDNTLQQSFDQTVATLGITEAWIGRTLMTYGMALDMEKERYTPAPI